MVTKLRETEYAHPELRLDEPLPEEVRPTARRRWWIKWAVWTIVGASAAVAYPYAYPWFKEAYPRIKAWLPGGSPPLAPSKTRAVPVLTATATRGNMALYLNGLGTVTALNTVTLKSRVDGELIKVSFREGQRVREGALLAELDRRPFEAQLAQAKGQLSKDNVALKVAKRDYERYKSLLASGLITPQQIDEQLSLVEQSEAAIQSDNGQIQNIELQLKYCRILSPINGRIGLRIVDAGNIVRANDPGGLAVITQLQPIAVVFTIPQDEIARVQQKHTADSPLKVAAFDRDFTHKLADGTLMAIDNQVDSTTGTVRLKALFQNEDELLFPNQFVNVRLLVDTKRDTVLIPTPAVQRGPDSTFVYVVTADSTVDLRTVVIGPTEGSSTAIESGLEPGEVVVTDGIDKLLPGGQVTVRGPDGGDKSGTGDKPDAGGGKKESRKTASGQKGP